MEIINYMESCTHSVNKALNEKLPPETATPCDLHKAMRYVVLNGGKRLRSAFIYSTGEALGADKTVLTDLCASVEMIHSASLAHDDLPALDNDDLRRGKPTCHIVFGEATAILVGDALQALATETIASINTINADCLLKMIRISSHLTGSYGLVGGEELDIEILNKKVDVKDIEVMYKLKTGCLLSASMIWLHWRQTVRMRKY